MGIKQDIGDIMQKYKKMFVDFKGTDSEGKKQTFYRSPYQLIDSLNSAKDEMSYSNYDNMNFDITIEIIKQFCKDNNLPDDLEK